MTIQTCYAAYFPYMRSGIGHTRSDWNLPVPERRFEVWLNCLRSNPACFERLDFGLRPAGRLQNGRSDPKVWMIAALKQCFAAFCCPLMQAIIRPACALGAAGHPPSNDVVAWTYVDMRLFRRGRVSVAVRIARAERFHGHAIIVHGVFDRSADPAARL